MVNIGKSEVCQQHMGYKWDYIYIYIRVMNICIHYISYNMMSNLDIYIYIIIIYYYYYNAITSGILIAYQVIPSGNEAWPTGKSLAVLLRFFFELNAIFQQAMLMLDQRRLYIYMYIRNFIEVI
jgi:hypothetical protein